MVKNKQSSAIVTICALNYFGKALALRASCLKENRECDFFIVVIDKKDQEIINRNPDVNLLWVEDLEISGFHRYAFKYDLIELSTNVKPTVLSGLLREYGTVVYLDPDIKLFSDLEPVYTALSSHAVAVTPHALTPILDGSRPSDLDFLRFGSFNLGFVGVKQCADAFSFLDWWSARCLEYGYYEPQTGLAVDQKWMDLAQCYFPSFKILRNPGLNAAFWNLHEREFSKVDGKWLTNDEPLYFFHFSSFDPYNPSAIANKQSRFEPGSRLDIQPLLDDYAKDVITNDHAYYSKFQYSYDYFDSGEYITPALRRFYAALEERFPIDENPFSMKSAAHRFAENKHLLIRDHNPSHRQTFKDLDQYSSSIRFTNFCLRILLRFVGANRYFAIMRFLAHTSSIRNQKDVVQVD